MPHFTVESTDNLRELADLPGLFRQVHDCLAASGLYPLAGIRSRAHWLDTWRMADGEADYAFVHCRLQIGSGRSETQRRATAEQVFTLIQQQTLPCCRARRCTPGRLVESCWGWLRGLRRYGDRPGLRRGRGGRARGWPEQPQRSGRVVACRRLPRGGLRVGN
ncbi:hypothetical protein C3F00_040040, partial [Pseudomonas sp. MWU13-2860]